MRTLRWILIFGLLLSAAIPSRAAKKLTVAQLEQALTADLAAKRQDADIARRIAGIVLTERIPRATLARLAAQFRSDPQTSHAIAVIANQAEFLELPASETVADAPPDQTAQARMLESTRQYVSRTLRGLPNLLARRTINLYDDRPQPLRQGDWPTRSGLHLVGTSAAEISVIREREDQPATQSSAVWQSKFGLVSGGEFGSTLGMILAESTSGEVTWSHWERGSTGLLAVFRYSVPASASHFEVISSLQREASVEGTRSARNARGVSGIELRPNVNSSNVEVIHTKPAYHGYISLDPANGTVYRITMEADMSKGLPFRRAAVLVEYGPVDVAGTRFICPLRSIAISEAQANAEAIAGDAVTVWLNETVFSDYHRFGSTSRIVSEAASTSAPESAEPASSASTSSKENEEHAAAPAAPAQAAPQGVAAPEIAPPSGTPATAALATATPQPHTSDKTEEAASLNASLAPAPKTADIPASPAATDQSNFALRVDVNSLLVPAVVLDKSGRYVGGLSKNDFVVLDDGKPRTVTGFTALRHAQDVEDKKSAARDGATPEPSKRHRFLIFLFDDRHMTTDELPLVQKAANRLLQEPLPDTDYAAVLSLMGANSGITHDETVLRRAVAGLSVHHALQHDRQDCPDVDYYAADQIIHQHNATEFQIAVEKAKQCSSIQVELRGEDPYNGMNNPHDLFQRAAMAAAARALAMGEEDARESLASVHNVVRAMSKLSGERVLILVSSGFLTLSPETMKLKSEIMDLAAASDVIVNALDTRGLYAGNLDASQGGSTSTIGMVTGQPAQNHLASMQAGENAMSELAVGTGGQFFHNNNDLLRGLKMLSAAPETSYLLEISLKGVKTNGAFHRLHVKIDKPGLEVLARKGYVAPSDAANKESSKARPRN